MAWNEPGGNGNNQDPWGGKDRNNGNRGNNDQGPPDLDEALRKLQDKLNSLFGSDKNGSSGGGDKSSSSGGGGFVLVIAAVVALGVWAAMGAYTVDQQERGVVLRLGKYYETVNPGLHWNPPLIDQVSIINTTRVREHDHKALMLTEDENIVDVSMVTQYVVSDPVAYMLQVRDPDGSLAQSAESALRQVVGSTDMHSILTEGRELLGIDVQARLQSYLDEYQTGLSVNKVNIKDAQAPSQVQDAFDDVIKAREDEQRAKNEAQSYANGIVPEARGRAQRILEEANAYREQVVARAEGETKRFDALLTEYQKAPVVTRERLYLDAMESVLSNNAKVLMDVEGGNNVMYLPMDKLMQNSSDRQSTTTTSPRTTRLDDQSVKNVTSQVIEELRQRQATVRREGR
ncbi:FtsH protease activity modulator HflK [Neptunomonas sp. CHC150]|uniref:FtsH protease activity modulator HflK n=1 Tax=Neptunomonas sp. CHC150 TaxID=2998324 RepID=UPI0025AF9957|nr:FtsH protease activity modulator HflK [Neptunomonas sp. CHC150]MDN2658479.1 FtsH protease activity modulator HflK [Neptunomonas sp. CHC150]